jgi:hypothetical protein
MHFLRAVKDMELQIVYKTECQSSSVIVNGGLENSSDVW